MPDPVARLDLATRIFGRGLGQQLLPVLVQGSEAMKEIRKATDPYGEALARLSPEAQKFNDQMYLLGVNVKTLAAESVHPLVQRLNEAEESFKKAQAAGLSFFQSITGFGVRGLTESVDDAKRNAPRHIAELLEQRKALENRNPRPEINLGKDTLAAGIAEIDKKIAYFRAIQGIKAGDDGEVLPPGISDTEVAARALKAGLGSDKSNKGKAAKKTPLEKMLELGEKRIAEMNGAGYDEQMVSVDSVAGQYAKKEADATEKLRQQYVAMADPLQKYRIELDQINSLRDAGLLTADQALAAGWRVNEQMDAQIDKINDLGEATKQTDNFARDMGLTMVSAFEDAAINGKKFGEVLQGLGKDIARIWLRKTVTEPMGNAITGLFEKGGIGDFFKNILVPGNHTGGIAGAEATFMRSISPALFAGAPRFHTGGIVGDEVPTILRPGEGVFTPGQMKAMGRGGVGDIRVELINSGTPQQVTRTMPYFDAQGLVLSIFIEDITRGGAASRHMESTYGLNRAAGAY